MAKECPKKSKLMLLSGARVVSCTALILAVASFAACAAKNYKVHPGANSMFDSEAYDTLMTSQAAIDQAKVDYSTHQLPASSKDLLNKAIDAYNVAEAAWHTYHGIVAGAQTGQAAALQQELKDDLDALTSAIAVFEQSAGKKIPQPAAKPVAGLHVFLGRIERVADITSRSPGGYEWQELGPCASPQAK